jgi:hypothetical protein
MPCPARGACSRYSATQACVIGVRRGADAVSATGRHGRAWTHSPSPGCPNPLSCLRIPRNACASRPAAGARCGRAARRDLCGGRRVTGVPTATFFLQTEGNLSRVNDLLYDARTRLWDEVARCSACMRSHRVSQMPDPFGDRPSGMLTLLPAPWKPASSIALSRNCIEHKSEKIHSL